MPKRPTQLGVLPDFGRVELVSEDGLGAVHDLQDDRLFRGQGRRPWEGI